MLAGDCRTGRVLAFDSDYHHLQYYLDKTSSNTHGSKWLTDETVSGGPFTQIPEQKSGAGCSPRGSVLSPLPVRPQRKAHLGQ